MTDWAKIRNDFPVVREVKYFMSAAMTPAPKPVLDFIIDHYKKFAEAGDIDWLREKNIHTACRNNCVRVAVNIFNNEEDIDCLLESLASFLSMSY